MNEIRFNPPPQEIPTITPEDTKKIKLKPLFKMVLKILVAIMIAVGLVFVIFINKDKIFGIFNGENFYNAVFLTNGEVYFGKIIKQDSDQIILKDVFYLQAQKAENGSQSVDNKMILAKLEQQFHGPTDELFINRSQVVFYEKLRDDSKVVESIKNYK
ncbi:MAG: hypothetical protein A2605_00970 [Candidatus Zambryskibacteria bacterium RIFOXYD1_FULL_39_35]|nr:MAG: hypothetical protein A2605_00970 [Candidatus Zambryskibacteria bacterium RIFOXYD1_FULL_39_35]